MIESRDRRFHAEFSNYGARREIERAGGADPGDISGAIEVTVRAGTPAGWAAQVLRELAVQLEREGGV